MNLLATLALRRAVHSVLCADDQSDSLSRITFTGVKDAANPSPTTFVNYHQWITEPDSGPHPNYSVRHVMYRLPLDAVESFSTKCPTEKEVTDHEYVKITPINDNLPENPVEQIEDMARTTKRLVLCTSCGTLRLIN